MNRVILMPVLAAAMLIACGPPASVEAPKDPAKEAWFPETVDRLTKMDRVAEQLLQGGKTQEAAAIVTSGQSLQNRLQTAPRPTLEAMQAIADLDQVYGKLLITNGYFGSARLLFQKNVTRWKIWKPQTPDTERRLKEANDGIAECDRHMGG